MHRTIKPRPHRLRHAAGVVAVGLVDLRFQHCPNARLSGFVIGIVLMVVIPVLAGVSVRFF